MYFSPNGDIQDFEKLLREVETHTNKWKKGVVVAGDLNAKTPLIGSSVRNMRGNSLEEFIMTNNMAVINEGSAPTFSSVRGNSVIDCTLCTNSFAKYIKDWRVDLECENLSDHNSIFFKVKFEFDEEQNVENVKTKGWKVTKERLATFNRAQRT